MEDEIFNKVDKLYQDNLNKDKIKNNEYKYNINLIPNINNYNIEDSKNFLLSSKLKIRAKTIEKIKKIPTYEQGTKEWLEARKGILTATKISDITGNGYNNINTLFNELTGKTKRTFTSNIYTRHGNKFENIARMIYEHLYDSVIEEYGLIKHYGNFPELNFNDFPRKINDQEINVNFLGASPDGIVGLTKKDNSFNSKVGRMLEIKCPYTRKINLSANSSKDAIGKIIPKNYWEQMQLQLEVCNLDSCDFIQCTIENIEYEDYDKNFTYEIKKGYKGKDIKNYDERIIKGMLIVVVKKSKYKLYTETKDFDKKEELHEYIYPDTLLKDKEGYLDYIRNKLINDPYIKKNYICIGIENWVLRVCHIIQVKRDKEWFNKLYPKLLSFWNSVLEERNKIINGGDGDNNNKNNKTENKYIETYILEDEDEDEDE